jgi:serine/threonine protein kinase
MAPEQLEGNEADTRTDIFAFGAIVYEMITGKKAFVGKSQASLIAAMLDRDPPALSTLQPMQANVMPGI